MSSTNIIQRLMAYDSPNIDDIQRQAGLGQLVLNLLKGVDFAWAQYVANKTSQVVKTKEPTPHDDHAAQNPCSNYEDTLAKLRQELARVISKIIWMESGLAGTSPYAQEHYLYKYARREQLIKEITYLKNQSGTPSNDPSIQPSFEEDPRLAVAMIEAAAGIRLGAMLLTHAKELWSGLPSMARVLPLLMIVPPDPVEDYCDPYSI